MINKLTNCSDFDRYIERINRLIYAKKTKSHTITYYCQTGIIIIEVVSLKSKKYIHGFSHCGKRLNDRSAKAFYHLNGSEG